MSKAKTDSSSPTRSESLRISKSFMTKKKDNPELGTLSDRNIELSPVRSKKITVEGLTNYLRALSDNIY